eukprot:UN20663
MKYQKIKLLFNQMTFPLIFELMYYLGNGRDHQKVMAKGALITVNYIIEDKYNDNFGSWFQS